jgi:hypothetical protein
VLSQPIVSRLVGGQVEDMDEIVAEFLKAVSLSERVIAGKLSLVKEPAHRYNPVGYVLSANKDAEDEKLQRRRRMTEDRAMRMQRQASTRILRNAVGS